MYPNNRSFLVGEGGFEPPKALPADLQSVPFGHSGIPPYLLLTTLPNPSALSTQIEIQRSGFDLKRKKRGAEVELSASPEAERSKSLLTMELVDGLEPATC